MTYNELVTAIQDYTENTFSTVDINTFITQAETRIYSTIQFPALSKLTSLSLTIGNQFLDAPADMLAVNSIAVVDPLTSNYSVLLVKDASFMREAYPNTTVTNTPKYYTIFGPQAVVPTSLQFQVAPTPDKAYAVELQYFYYPESITTAATGRTWLGDNFSPVLLYGSLVEAYTMMKGEADMLALYDTKYKEAIALAKRMGDGMQKTDNYRSGAPIVKV